MRPEDIDIKRLYALGIYELREIGRIVGVKSPTSQRRDVLLSGIKARIKSGNFERGPVRGRKPRGMNLDVSKIMNSEEGISPYVNSVLARDVTEQSGTQGTARGEERAVSGYMHLLPSGSAVLIGVDLNGYTVSAKLLRAHNYKTGDHVEGKAIYSSQRNCFVVEELAKIDGDDSVRFDARDGIRPNKKCTDEFLMGERVLVTTPKPFDKIEFIAKTAGEVPSDAYKVALIIDETDDSVAFLQSCGIQDTYLLKVNYGIQRQTIGCLLALFRAKEAAEQGKNVVLFVDSFNKLFRIYNSAAYSDGRINPTQINLAPLVDLKTFFISARVLRDGGSLTILGLLNFPTNPTEEYINSELTDLAQKILKMT